MSMRNKKVLVRIDCNVPLKHGKIADDFKIRAHIPTIKGLLRQGAQVFLITHLEQNGIVPHLDFLLVYLERALGTKVGFIRGRVPVSVREYRERVILFDNIRLNPGEKKNDKNLARRIAAWGNLYINDAFAESHRPYASIISIPKLLPSFLGPVIKNEMRMLSKLFHPPHPFLAIISGNKFATKEPFIKKFLQRADGVFIGGALANTFLSQRGIAVGKSRTEKVSIPKSILEHPKIILPVDGIKRGGAIYDIGPETAKILADLVKNSRCVLWNGTLGVCEKGFVFGTRALARAIGASRAYSVVGGGDTAAAIHALKLKKNFDFISTGGGAMLDFLVDGGLPGIDAIQKKRKLK